MAATLSRIAVVAVAIGLFGAALLVGDHGAARAAVGQPTGPLVATDRPDAAVLVAQGMKPGESRAGEVTVTNVGDAAGAFALGATGLSQSSARLSDVLNLTVQDVTPGRSASQLYNGSLQSLSGVALGTLQQGEARRYRLSGRDRDHELRVVGHPLRRSPGGASEAQAPGQTGRDPARHPQRHGTPKRQERLRRRVGDLRHALRHPPERIGGRRLEDAADARGAAHPQRARSCADAHQAAREGPRGDRKWPPRRGPPAPEGDDGHIRRRGAPHDPGGGHAPLAFANPGPRRSARYNSYRPRRISYPFVHGQ
jgi:hypothetical protein